PAAAHVLTGGMAVRQDRLVAAAGLFEGVTENGQALERALLVDRLSQVRNDTPIPRQPATFEGRGTEGIADDIAEQRVPRGASGPVLRVRVVVGKRLPQVVEDLPESIDR